MAETPLRQLPDAVVVLHWCSPQGDQRQPNWYHARESLVLLVYLTGGDEEMVVVDGDVDEGAVAETWIHGADSAAATDVVAAVAVRGNLLEKRRRHSGGAERNGGVLHVALPADRSMPECGVDVALGPRVPSDFLLPLLSSQEGANSRPTSHRARPCGGRYEGAMCSLHLQHHAHHGIAHLHYDLKMVQFWRVEVEEEEDGGLGEPTHLLLILLLLLRSLDGRAVCSPVQVGVELQQL